MNSDPGNDSFWVEIRDAKGLVTLRQVFSIIIVIGRIPRPSSRILSRNAADSCRAARIDNLPKEADYRLSILRQAASAAASGSESSSRCAPLGAGEETSRAISLETA